MLRIALFFIILTYSSFSLSEPIKVNSNLSPIIIGEFFFNQEPVEIFIDTSNKEVKWGYGYWENEKGYANISFTQTGPDLILTSSSLKAKKVMKDWGFEKGDYQLNKKKSFRSDNSPALVNLAKINNLNCFVFATQFGRGFDYNNRDRSNLSGYYCSFQNELTLDKAINFLHCIQVKGQGTHFVGRETDDQCNIENTNLEIRIEENDNNTKTNNNQSDEVEEKLKKLKNLFDKELISKKEYDERKKVILDQL